MREALPALRAGSDPSGAVRELRDAALADEEGREFEATLARLCENQPGTVTESNEQEFRVSEK